MSCPAGGGRTLSQFALVSYLPISARFLISFAWTSPPQRRPRAHVTILPPRPLHAEINSMIQEMAQETRLFPPFEIVLGEIRVFPVSNVIYVSIAKGEHELHALHENLTRATGIRRPVPVPSAHHDCAGHLSAGEGAQLAARAREKWAAYDGPRSFMVEKLAFVQNVAPQTWVDLAGISLAVPVAAGR